MLCSTPHFFFHSMLTNISLLPCDRALGRKTEICPGWESVGKDNLAAELLSLSAQCRQSWCKDSLLGCMRGLLIFRYPPPTDSPLIYERYWAMTVAKCTDLGATCSGFKFQLCYSLAVLHQACYLASLCLNLLLYKMRVILVPPLPQLPNGSVT